MSQKIKLNQSSFSTDGSLVVLHYLVILIIKDNANCVHELHASNSYIPKLHVEFQDWCLLLALGYLKILAVGDSSPSSYIATFGITKSFITSVVKFGQIKFC